MKTASFLLVAVVALLSGSPAQAQTPVATGASAAILPGDQIALRIDREPTLSDTFNVDMNGEVVLPRLGVVRVADQSAGALQETLRTQYARFLRDPAIAVTVLRRVMVQGEVYKPGILMVDLTTTLPELIGLAGGITEDGDPRHVQILRANERLRVGDYTQLSVEAAELRSGDRVLVPRRAWIARNPNVAIGTFTGLVTFFIGIVQLVKR